MTNVLTTRCNERHTAVWRALYGVFLAAGTFVVVALYAVSCATDALQQAVAAEAKASHNGEALAEIHTDVREIRAAVFRIENGE